MTPAESRFCSPSDACDSADPTGTLFASVIMPVLRPSPDELNPILKDSTG
jgi:hypothetical protein